MAALTLPAGYWVEQTRAAFTAHSPYGPLGDDFDCWAEACFAAQDAADAAAEDDDLPATVEFREAA